MYPEKSYFVFLSVQVLQLFEDLIFELIPFFRICYVKLFFIIGNIMGFIKWFKIRIYQDILLG